MATKQFLDKDGASALRKKILGEVEGVLMDFSYEFSALVLMHIPEEVTGLLWDEYYILDYTNISFRNVESMFKSEEYQEMFDENPISGNIALQFKELGSPGKARIQYSKTEVLVSDIQMMYTGLTGEEGLLIDQQISLFNTQLDGLAFRYDGTAWTAIRRPGSRVFGTIDNILNIVVAHSYPLTIHGMGADFLQTLQPGIYNAVVASRNKTNLEYYGTCKLTVMDSPGMVPGSTNGMGRVYMLSELELPGMWFTQNDIGADGSEIDTQGYLAYMGVESKLRDRYYLFDPTQDAWLAYQKSEQQYGISTKAIFSTWKKDELDLNNMFGEIESAIFLQEGDVRAGINTGNTEMTIVSIKDMYESLNAATAKIATLETSIADLTSRMEAVEDTANFAMSAAEQAQQAAEQAQQMASEAYAAAVNPPSPDLSEIYTKFEDLENRLAAGGL